MPDLDILFPARPLGYNNTLSTFAELRELDPSAAIDETNVLVPGAGHFVWNAASLAQDDGKRIIKPADRTSLEVGRWVLSRVWDAGTGPVAMFGDMGSLEAPSTVGTLYTIGHASEGWGAASYIYDPAVDEAYVAANPRTSFLTYNERGFRLNVRTATPYEFGGIGYDYEAENIADDLDPLQACLDYIYPRARRSNTRVDLSTGKWGVSETIYAAYPYIADEEPARVKWGTIRPLPVARQPGGVPMEYVVVMSGPRNFFEGKLYVNGFNDNGTQPRLHSPAQRRFVNGVKLAQASATEMPDIRVDGAIRHGIDLTTQFDTFREGTPYEFTIPANNQISTMFKAVYARYCGSCTWDNTLYHHEKLAFTANTHGGLPRTDPIEDATFVADDVEYAASQAQVSKLTMADTGWLRNGDYVKIANFILPAVFGTVALNKTARTMVWSAGDPVVDGKLVVGDVIQIRHDAGLPETTVNYVDYEIAGFSGTSNRTIHLVNEPDVDLAARSVEKLRTGFSVHFVVRCTPDTSIEIYPWLSSRTTAGDAIAIYGAVLNAPGIDTSGVTWQCLTGNSVGIGINAAALLGLNGGTAVLDYCELSVVQGLDVGAASSGNTIAFLHSEVTERDFLQMMPASEFCGFVINSVASIPGLFRAENLAPRALPADVFARVGSETLFNVDFNIGGHRLQTVVMDGDPGNPFAGESREVSNLQGYNDRVFWANTFTAGVGYDVNHGRLNANANRATVRCIGPTGAGPSGSFIFEMNEAMQRRGWQFIGSGTFSAGDVLGTADQVVTFGTSADPYTIEFLFNMRTKKVAVQQYVGG